MRKELCDGFTAMAIASMDEITPARGATSGLLHPSGIAKHYCGMDGFTVGDIMAYGFRRFGYPVNGWDEYKQLCQWILRTPMEGVFLTVQPTALSPFGFLLKDPLSQELSDEQMLPFIEWGQQCQKWAKEQYGVTLINNFHYAGCYTEEELDVVCNQWMDKTYPETQGETLELIAEGLGITEEDIIERFWKEKRQECERLAAEYKQTHPSPERCHLCHALDKDAPETPFWEHLPEDSLERRINEAMYRTILDLQRPVSIRDWQIDIMGKCSREGFRVYTEDADGYEELTQDYFAPVSLMAGHGLKEAS